MSRDRKKLIEVALPLGVISDEAAKEKSVPRRGHPQTIHLWWARRPLAAARAVLFAQLVDDPSSCPEAFPTDEAQTKERHRLFEIVQRLVRWESSNDPEVINEARREIARSYARDDGSKLGKSVLAGTAAQDVIDAYLQSHVPPVHDPFCGGGTIPLEAQRLGLRVLASDLNPIPVVITKALVEVPSLLRNLPAVNPESRRSGARGLAEEVAFYSRWITAASQRSLGRFYPEAELPEAHGGGSAPAIAWMWVRTVESPNPAFKGCHVPLAATFWLSTKAGNEVWIEPVVRGKSYTFEVRHGGPADRDAVANGTKLGRGANFRCILSNTPIEPEYIKEEGRAKRLGARLIAVVVEGSRKRIYVPPTEKAERAALVTVPTSVPEQELPNDPRNFWTVNYGLTRFADLFSPRQLLTLSTILDLIGEARKLAVEHAKDAGLSDDGTPLRDGGTGACAFGEAVALYLSLGLGRLLDYNSTICTWNVIGGSVRSTFARQSIPMTWDYYETNPLADTTGSWSSCVSWVVDVLRAGSWPGSATVSQRDAAAEEALPTRVITSTDPPYYDNIAYADLSDFFYVWLRRSLKEIYPTLFATVGVPKDDELVASMYRFGGDKRAASEFFERRIALAFDRIRRSQQPDAPITIFYAFKQAEEEVDTALVSSTGWETMLDGLVRTGLVVDGTLPMRTERAARTIGLGANALASSIVLVCRTRPDDAPSSTRGEFRRMLRKELPDALKKLQQGNIAPVDVAQASIGPGMAIFSRHKQVLEADGKPMTVRAALQLINEVLDEYLASGEGDFDADTRFAITWYEQHGWEPGSFGDAETLAKARNVSVDGVEEAGIVKKGGGKVRILKRHEMRPLDYDPAADERPTVWEFTQHMIRNLEVDGEAAAARLLKKLGSAADATRELAYRLYNTCERKKWTEDARSYNALILAWTELEKLAAKMGDEAPPTAPSKPSKGTNGKKKAEKATKAPKKGQQTLFEGDD